MTFEHSNGDTNISKENQSKNYTQPEVAELLEHWSDTQTMLDRRVVIWIVPMCHNNTLADI